jgi:hypothetical protein
MRAIPRAIPAGGSTKSTTGKTRSTSLGLLDSAGGGMVQFQTSNDPPCGPPHTETTSILPHRRRDRSLSGASRPQRPFRTRSR